MPRGKKGQYALAQDGNGGLSPAVVDGSSDSVPGLPGVPAFSLSYAEAFAALAGIFVHDEGWLRIVSHEHGDTVYFKFKFAKGKYAGSYVFYRVDDLDYAAAFVGILAKIRAVYAGTLRPTPDHAYE